PVAEGVQQRFPVTGLSGRLLQFAESLLGVLAAREQALDPRGHARRLFAQAVRPADGVHFARLFTHGAATSISTTRYASVTHGWPSMRARQRAAWASAALRSVNALIGVSSPSHHSSS